MRLLALVKWLAAAAALAPLVGCGVRATPEPVAGSHAGRVVAPTDGQGRDSTAAAGRTTKPPPDTRTPPSGSPNGATRQPSEPPPAGFAYTSKPQIAKAPKKGVVAYVSGRRFDVGAVVFEYAGDKWQLLVTPSALSNSTAAVQEGEFISIELPRQPSPGLLLDRPLSHGGGFWRIADPDAPDELVNWNAPLAWQLKVSTWNAKPYAAGGPPRQVVGTAAGVVAITFRGNARLPDAWLAGTFSQAIVRYAEPPPANR